jgi:hypothetical protein
MRRLMLGSIAAAVALTLTLTASAFARAGDRTVTQTYPVATALCVKAHTGTLPPKLAPSAAAVRAACDALENAFPTLVSTVDGAESTYLSTVSAQKALVATVCAKPVTNKAACEGARATQTSTDGTARTTLQTARTAYHTAIEANRVSFWNTISALR